LAFAYFATQGWYLIAGFGFDAGEMFMIDIFTIALVFCKATARCPDVEFRTASHHLRCMIAALTPCDRIVLGIFPLVWIVYVLTISDFARWWLLYALSMAQFVATGAEAYTEWRKAKASSEPDIPSSGLMFAVARAGRWST
jgi:hypothetical protein